MVWVLPLMFSDRCYQKKQLPNFVFRIQPLLCKVSNNDNNTGLGFDTNFLAPLLLGETNNCLILFLEYNLFYARYQLMITTRVLVLSLIISDRCYQKKQLPNFILEYKMASTVPNVYPADKWFISKNPVTAWTADPYTADI